MPLGEVVAGTAKGCQNAVLLTLGTGVGGGVILDGKAMKQGDAVAKAVVDQYIEWLGEMVTNFINIFRPEMLLLSGGICGQGKVLTDPLNAYAEQYAFAGKRIFIAPVPIAKLGDDAGVIAAANLS